MIFNPSIGPIAAASGWLPLLFDTIVLALTLARTLSLAQRRSAAPRDIVHALVRQGLLYYALIFSVTLVLTIMIAVADVSVRNITAQLELCLTVTMMSRITLDLKRFAHEHAHSAQRHRRDNTRASSLSPEAAEALAEAAFPPRSAPDDAEGSVGAETSFFAMVTRDDGDVIAGEDQEKEMGEVEMRCFDAAAEEGRRGSGVDAHGGVEVEDRQKELEEEVDPCHAEYGGAKGSGWGL